MRHANFRLPTALALGAFLALSGPASGAEQPPLEDVLQILQERADELGLTPSDLSEVVVADSYFSEHSGILHLYLQQHHAGIPVHNALINLNIDRDGRIVHLGSRFVPNLAAAARGADHRLSGRDAVETAFRHLGLAATEPLIEERALSARQLMFSDAGVSLQPIPAKLVYLPDEKRRVRLVWTVGIYTLDAQHYWVLFVDAATGQVVRRDDRVAQDSWEQTDAPGEVSFLEAARRSGGPGDAATTPRPGQASTGPTSNGLDGSAYRVYPVPVESPSHAGDPSVDLRSLVVDPADPTASPLGWHDTDTNQFTVTRGNNVHAYTDVDADNVPDLGSDPDGGADLEFDFPVDFSMEPDTYRPAAVTNLFYWNNAIHDIAYRYGFDEAAGNFQVNNFGLGGLGNDDVRAEAQDGSGTNNANFFTPSDGNRPRMQMFRWTAPAVVTVNPPSPIADDYDARGAAFGPPLMSTGITGDVALVDDGVEPATDGCEPLVGFPPGEIALLDRGQCTFVQKVNNAQDAGAIAVIVANNVPGPPVTMGGNDPGIVIPSAMISLDDGDLFKANLPLESTIKKGGADRDSDFDNGVIVHEYTHGISNRLTGGPNNVDCLDNEEQMGEGWSDYFAVMLTDIDVDHRGIGTYVIFEPTDGVGIRPFAYNPDFAVNPATYDDIQVFSVPHGVGFVWATMLWDMTRALVDRHGFDPDIPTGTGGNNLALQLVTDGMKLQPCSPGFVDGRDAVLSADAILTDGANQCLIWDAFANRGLGFSADQGSSDSRDDGTEAFDLPLSCCTFAILEGKVIALRDSGALNPGQANSLLRKLDAAEAAIARGRIKAGINILQAFINQVLDFVEDGVLTEAQGLDLTECAEGVIARTEENFPDAT